MRELWGNSRISVIAFLLMTVPFASSACTIFMKQQDDCVLVGNNEDYFYSFPSTVSVSAADDGLYGRISFALSSCIQGGMNEKGLFYDGASCPATEVRHVAENTNVGMDFGDTLLAKCATVEEAVEMLKKVNIPGDFYDHLLLVDKTGAAVVVEWVENELRIIPKQKKYLIATNFWLSKPELGGYPCQRYDYVEKALDSGNTMSVQDFADILQATVQNWAGGGTLYTNVYNITSGDVYIYQEANFKKCVKINIIKQMSDMKKGEKRVIQLKKLFALSPSDEIIPVVAYDETVDWSIPAGVGGFLILALITTTFIIKRKGKKCS